MKEIEDNLTCHDIGISGNCGGDCPLLLRGECPDQEEMEQEIPRENA